MDAPKAGDVVRLKSGGPKMTCGKETDEVRRIKCHWFIRASFYEQYSTSGYFPLASLVVENDEPGQGETETAEAESEHQDKFHLGDPALMAGVRVTIARVCGRAGRYDVKVGEGDSYTVWKDICECRLRPAPKPHEESADG